MCTVTFLPIQDNNFVLFSSRDEAPLRGNVTFPSYSQNRNLLFPKDERGGGSWLVSSNKGRTACLLNGASQKHHRQEYYRLSRGQVVLDSFDFSTPHQFAIDYNLKDIEPFTLIWVQSLPELKLYEVKWDGNQSLISEYSVNEMHIWSSVTLYNPDMVSQRKRWFKDWFENNPKTVDSLSRFHYQAGIGNAEFDIKMKREGVETVSISSVVSNKEGIKIKYSKIGEVEKEAFLNYELQKV